MRTLIFCLTAVCLLGFAAAQATQQPAAAPAAKAPEAQPATSTLKSDMEKVSYGVGYNLGKNWRQRNLELNIEGIAKGMADGLKGNTPLVSEEELGKLMNAYAENKMKEIREKNTKDGEAFRAEFKKKPGIVETPEGILYRVIEPGSGECPTDADTVKVHYTGKTVDGQVFDSSVERNEPAEFPVGGVITGWGTALKLMRPGAKWEIVIPPSLAYGDQGAGGVIGPATTLVFEVSLLEVKKGQPADMIKAEPAAAPAK